MFEEYKWYIVHTHTNCEDKVAENIIRAAENRNMRDQILEVCVPTETETVIENDKRKEKVHKLFPGYVLVKMVMTACKHFYSLEASSRSWSCLSARLRSSFASLPSL